jgi:hypothetical protein
MARLTRRSVLRKACACLGTLICGHDVAKSAQAYPANEPSVELWMDQWINSGRKSDGALPIGRFRDPIYFLLRPIGWRPNADQQSFPSVSVPAGFVTDFGSVPRLFFSVLRPDGVYTFPAIVHDYLYWTQNVERTMADTIFKLTLEDVGVNSVTIEALYNATKVFGGAVWNENSRLKSAGEKRILRRFPENVNTTWVEWKKLPNVFSD